MHEWLFFVLIYRSIHRGFPKVLWCVDSKSAAAAAAKSLQSCPTLCDPIDGSALGSSVPGILQARILEWVAISFSNAWKWKVKVKSLSRAWLLATPWTAAYQAPPSMGFSRQEPLGKCNSKPQWDTTSLLLRWLQSKKGWQWCEETKTHTTN